MNNQVDQAPINKLIHEPARLRLVSILSVIKRADCVFLMNEGGFSWGNLSSHLSKLEAAQYVRIEKTFVGKKPNTIVELTKKGRDAFGEYRKTMQGILAGE